MSRGGHTRGSPVLLPPLPLPAPRGASPGRMDGPAAGRRHTPTGLGKPAATPAPPSLAGAAGPGRRLLRKKSKKQKPISRAEGWLCSPRQGAGAASAPLGRVAAVRAPRAAPAPGTVWGRAELQQAWGLKGQGHDWLHLGRGDWAALSPAGRPRRRAGTETARDRGLPRLRPGNGPGHS